MEINSILSNATFQTWVIAALILILTYIVLRSLQNFAIRRGSIHAAATETKLDDLFIDVLKTLKRYFVFGVSLYVSLVWVKVSPRARLLIDKAFIIVILIQLSQIAGLIINFWIGKHLKTKSTQDLEMASTVSLISFGVKAIVYSIIVLLALNNLGIDITALVAGLGVGGIAVALALQNILTDLFSSLTIVMDKPFIVGDFIIIDSLAGTVENIGLKTTRIRSISGEQLIFGNGDLLKSRIKNYKRMSERRVVQNLTVTYQTTSDQLEQIPGLVTEIVKNQKKIRFDRCHFLRFQDSSLEFELVYWVLSPEFNDYADIAQSINLGIFKKFSAEKIDFAYPTRTLHLQSPSRD